MAVSSLTRFTVPLGGNQSATTQGLLMPKLSFRYRVLFDNFGVSNPKTELTKQVVKIGRPNVQMEGIELPVYNSYVYIAARPKWQTVVCSFRDDASGSVSRLIGEQLQKQFDFMEQASSSSAIDYKFITTLEMLDGANGNTDPTVIETWQLYGCFISDMKYGDADYGKNDPIMLDMTIRYDNAIQTTGGGVGAPGITQFNFDRAVTG